MSYEQRTVIEQALVRFFSTCNRIVGSEANYQALLASELEKDYPGQVRREHKLAATGRGGIDVAVLRPDGDPQAVFELKGGAYNNRNALRDVFNEGGVCRDRDTDKLAKVSISPDLRWLVAVDAVELGRSLSYTKQVRVREEAEIRGVSFAYYAHGDGCNPSPANM